MVIMTGNDLQKIFSNNIYTARINLVYSQMKLAELADISTGFLCDIERGLKTGTFDTIVKISNALHKEPYELFIPDGETNVKSSLSLKEKKDLLAKLSLSLKKNVNSTIQKTIDEF